MRVLVYLLLLIEAKLLLCYEHNDMNNTTTTTDITCVLNNVTNASNIHYKSYCANEVLNIIFKNSQLFRVPRIFDTYPLIRALDISNCSIQHIDTTIFNKASMLTSLYMSGNNISTLPNYLFSRASHLTSLELAVCNITIINAQTFQGLINLTRLDLSFNEINILKEGIFDELLKLETIRLNNNQIEVINEVLFNRNTHLKFIYLSNNIIKLFQPRTIKSAHFISLDLANNPLKYIDLSSLEHIKTLYLGNTTLDTLHVPLTIEDISAENNNIYKIRSLNGTNLKRLSLSKNKISDFNNFMLFTNLEVLDISYNNLHNIDFFDMKNLKNLKQLNLIGNNISHFNVHDLKKYLPKLTMIELSVFNWTKDNVNNLKKEIQDQNIYSMLDEKNDITNYNDGFLASTTSTDIPLTPPNQDNNLSTSEINLVLLIHKNLSLLEYRFSKIINDIEYLKNFVNTSNKTYSDLANITQDLLDSNKKWINLLMQNNASENNNAVASDIKTIKNLIIILSSICFLLIFYKIAIFITNKMNFSIYRHRIRSTETLQPMFEQDL